jgi:aminopeptidase N
MQDDDFFPEYKIFLFPGSIEHYPPILPVKIDHMTLKIQPDFESSILKNCEEILRITALQNISEIGLDIAEICIHNVTSCNGIPVDRFDTPEASDKLIIKFRQILEKGHSIELKIIYSAGYYYKQGILDIRIPRSGFHFIRKPSVGKQAWTQGQASESKYWFPCLEDPRVKFPREIHVTVPDQDLIVISNGMLISSQADTWKWREVNPIPAYLTSVVIGKFTQQSQQYSSDQASDKTNIMLSYYWPPEISKEHAMLTFAHTPIIMKLFEDYFGIKYPYQRYSQVAVEEFELLGMENTSCTTLSESLLHDEMAAIDFVRDVEIVAHEFSHQWFGDLVTCKDWSDLWLNEGFATYCELIFWEKTRGFDMFLYKLIKTADIYIEETKYHYNRPLVTRIYKHPDYLFDAHCYQKGACVLNMLRNHIGEDALKVSLRIYLETFKDKNAETDDLRKIIEDTTRENMQKFFDQWIYTPSHPQLDIEISLESPDKIRFKIRQSQVDFKHKRYNAENQNLHRNFEFTLEVKITFSTENNNTKILEQINISKTITEHSIKIPENTKIEGISIDPNYKILKEIKSLKIANETKDFQLKEIIKNQLRKGLTVVERVEAARALKQNFSQDIVDELVQSIMVDPFYGVSVEAASTLGSYYEGNNYDESILAYQALVSCINNEKAITSLHPEIKEAIIKAIGNFGREESLYLLKSILRQENESYFVRAAAAMAIGKSSKNIISSIEKHKVISLLKELVKTTKSFRNVISTGAIEGLQEFSKEKDKDIVINVINFLVESTSSKNDYYIRLAATLALGKFSYALIDEKNSKIEKGNQEVLNQLLTLLKDNRRKLKINACCALVDKDSKPSKIDYRTFKALEALISVAEHDLDGFVRKEAERCANILREWMNEWSNKPLTIDVNIREEQK